MQPTRVRVALVYACQPSGRLTMTHTRNHVRNRTPLLIALSMTLAMAFATAQEAGLVEVDGAVLAYESSGSPDNGTVLLIAGTGMQLIDWPNELVEGLVGRGHRVIRFDNRDVGL